MGLVELRASYPDTHINNNNNNKRVFMPRDWVFVHESLLRI